ncbi:MAG: PQQ-binding-like beta-propeller repeat protein [Alphaproteobacteria bacterium]|nr:PQQ-binding-like beta-propeller repeat protein [Alphaproteobacteria bacterium]
MSFSRMAAGAVLAVTLAGCGDTFFGADQTPRLPGERISVLLANAELEPDPNLREVSVLLPRPFVNRDWPQLGGSARHVAGHLALTDAPEVIWSTSIGGGSDSSASLIAAPIVADGRVFVLNSESELIALDQATGDELWEVDLVPEDEDAPVGAGGVAYRGGRLFAATGFAEVVALDAMSGDVLWRGNASAPVRSAPSVASGRVFAITVDNQLLALDEATGERLWAHAGIQETAGLLGGSSPAVDNNVVVAPYTSGEVFALRIENGRVLWTDALIAVRRQDALSALAAIRGLPVIDGSLAFAVSHSGRMAAIDVRSGLRVWDREIGGTQTPWVAGDWLFVLTDRAQIVALRKETGQVRWVAQLPRFEDPEDEEDEIRWVGPVLASDRLIAVSSEGEAIAVSPYTGEILGSLELPDGVQVPPVVAGETLFLLTDDGDVLALR